MKKIEPGSGGHRSINRSIALVAAGAMLALGLLAGSQARADESVGTVSQVTGTAQIQRGGASIPAQPGTALRLHDTVSTQSDSTATLGFADGSSMVLKGGTSVELDDSAVINGQTVPSRVTLMSGSVHTIVPDKTTGQQHRLEVDSENAKATGPSPNQ